MQSLFFLCIPKSNTTNIYMFEYERSCPMSLTYIAMFLQIHAGQEHALYLIENGSFGSSLCIGDSFILHALNVTILSIKLWWSCPYAEYAEYLPTLALKITKFCIGKQKLYKEHMGCSTHLMSNSSMKERILAGQLQGLPQQSAMVCPLEPALWREPCGQKICGQPEDMWQKIQRQALLQRHETEQQQVQVRRLFFWRLNSIKGLEKQVQNTVERTIHISYHWSIASQVVCDQECAYLNK